MRRAWIVLLAAGVGGSIPRPVDACSWCEPRELVLAGGATQPANAGVWAYGTLVDDIVATVDGVPTDVEVIPGVDLTATPVSAPALVRTSTPAPAGSLVRMELPDPAPCFGEPGDASGVVEFTAGPADGEAPAPPLQLHWDLAEYEYFIPGDDCGLDLLGGIDVRGTLPPEPEGSAPRVLEVEVASGDTTLVLVRVQTPEGAFDRGISLTRASFEGVTLDEMCVRATVLDTAGHRGVSTDWVCRPCHAVDLGTVDPGDNVDPRFGPDNEYPDGICPEPAPPPEDPDDPPAPDDPSTTTDGPAPDPVMDDEATTGADTDPGADGAFTDRGCACRSESRAPLSAAGFGILALLCIGGRRRYPRPR